MQSVEDPVYLRPLTAPLPPPALSSSALQPFTLSHSLALIADFTHALPDRRPSHKPSCTACPCPVPACLSGLGPKPRAAKPEGHAAFAGSFPTQTGPLLQKTGGRRLQESPPEVTTPGPRPPWLSLSFPPLRPDPLCGPCLLWKLFPTKPPDPKLQAPPIPHSKLRGHPRPGQRSPKTQGLRVLSGEATAAAGSIWMRARQPGVQSSPSAEPKPAELGT